MTHTPLPSPDPIEYDRLVSPDAAPWSRTFRAMGCQMVLTLAAGRHEEAERAFTDGVHLVEEAEQCLSRFRPDSELSRLNDRAGVWTDVSPMLAAVLQLALRSARQTGGLCTPTLLRAIEAAGYDRDFHALTPSAELGSVVRGTRLAAPGQVARRRLRPMSPPRARHVTWRAVQVNAQTLRARLPSGVRLDLAGVAKGWTADRLADLLGAIGPCLVDAGGDLAARGTAPGLNGWPVAIADPHQPDADLALVMLRDAGLATSGTDFRRWSQGGQARHHLIDPRTGLPARTDLLTASVIAPTTAAADVHAKVALLLGRRRGLAYLARNSLAGLLVGQDRRVCTTPRWSSYVLAC